MDILVQGVSFDCLTVVNISETSNVRQQINYFFGGKDETQLFNDQLAFVRFLLHLSI